MRTDTAASNYSTQVLAGVVATSLLFACALSVKANPLSDVGFSYSGFSFEMNLSIIRNKYPKSSHEFSPQDGSRIIFASDNPSQFDDLIRRGSGTYIIRLTADESHNDLYYVQAEIHRGVIRRLRLSFEKPSELINRPNKSEFEKRHPPCNGIKAELIRMYAKPNSAESSWEEQLQSISSNWVKWPHALTLSCGRYHKRKKLFAMEITLDRMVVVSELIYPAKLTT